MNPGLKARGLQQSELLCGRPRISRSHMSRLSLFEGYVRNEIGTLGCEASPNLYGAVLKEKEGLLGVLHAKPFLNLVKATIT